MGDSALQSGHQWAQKNSKTGWPRKADNAGGRAPSQSERSSGGAGYHLHDNRRSLQHYRVWSLGQRNGDHHRLRSGDLGHLQRHCRHERLLLCSEQCFDFGLYR